MLLNASYEPLLIVNWQKALILWFQEKVEVIGYHRVVARSESARYQIPSVMLLKQFINSKRTSFVRFSRENVFWRDDHTCQYCYQKYSRKELTLDHLIPVSRGGKKNWTNIVTACRPCNQKKGNKLLNETPFKLLRDPTTPRHLSRCKLYAARKNFPSEWSSYLAS